MNFLVQNWLLILVALSSGAMLLFPALTGGLAQGGMAVSDAVQKMNHEKGVLLDVREEAEFSAEHIAQARLAPLGQLEQKLPQLVKNKSLPVMFVCVSGARSARAVQVARKLGYEQAYSVAGGMRAWKSANMPVVTAKA